MNDENTGHIEPTDAEVSAFKEAWEAERKRIGRGVAPAGTKTRAGLRAAFAVSDAVYGAIESMEIEGKS